MRVPRITLPLVCLALSVLPMFAQSPNANINGQVLDPSSRVIVGAEIIAVNDSTGVKYTTQTSGEGIYVLPNLPPGPYRLQVSKLGFKTIIKPDIVLNIQDALAINFTLPVGASMETVTVEGGAPLVNTETPEVGTVIDRNFVENLPLNGRSFNTLLQLTPGVVLATSASATNPGQFSIAGQRTDANNFTVDGVSANFGVSTSADPGNSGTGTAQAFSVLGGTSSLVSVDALQEFRTQTSAFAPEFGRAPGGQVTLSTRSGTNDFHGGAFDYFRNTVMDANNWFANNVGLPRVPEHHNDFGVFLGGPIRKDKTFFFFSYEGARLRLPESAPILVPSEYARQTASPQLAPYLDVYPLPNDRTAVPGIYTAQFTGSYSNQSTLNATSVRLDHTFNNRFSIFGRYNDAPSQLVQSNFVELDTVHVDTGSGSGDTLLVGFVRTRRDPEQRWIQRCIGKCSDSLFLAATNRRHRGYNADNLGFGIFHVNHLLSELALSYFTS
ncbi:MAG: TonB-dependent receptor [Candidatus Korobacteraceae bacterium]